MGDTRLWRSISARWEFQWNVQTAVTITSKRRPRLSLKSAGNNSLDPLHGRPGYKVQWALVTVNSDQEQLALWLGFIAHGWQFTYNHWLPPVPHIHPYMESYFEISQMVTSLLPNKYWQINGWYHNDTVQLWVDSQFQVSLKRVNQFRLHKVPSFIVTVAMLDKLSLVFHLQLLSMVTWLFHWFQWELFCGKSNLILESRVKSERTIRRAWSEVNGKDLQM